MEQGAEVHVARQPIFDINLNVFGYELLFRDHSRDTAYNGKNGDQATHDVIANSFLLIGIEQLTGGKKAFINFTANSLRANLPASLPSEVVVVEILENIIPDEAILQSCRTLKRKDYLLALDDFVFAPEYLPLIKLADIIKVDFLATSRKEQQLLPSLLKNFPVKFLAEKVETQDDFLNAVQMGYSYFQGYFFCKPVILSGKTLPEFQINYFHILQEINRPELEFTQIETIIKRDISLTYKLLKFINSSFFGFRGKISSLRQALTLLGPKELTKWVSLLVLKKIGQDKPGELIAQSLIRARFAENLATGRLSAAKVANAFLIGMFSYIDVLLDRPMGEVLTEIPLDQEIKNVLLRKGNNELFILAQLIQAYEKGDWVISSSSAAQIGIDEHTVLKSFQEALQWSHVLMAANA